MGTDYTLYYILGGVLAALMLLLVYLVIKKFSEDPRDKKPTVDKPETVVDKPAEVFEQEVIPEEIEPDSVNEPAEKVVEE